jgi:hypothetical protein
MSAVATARATTCPRWWLASGIGLGHFGWGAGRRSTRLAADISLATRAGHVLSVHRPSGRRSFRKKRTVSPPIAHCRYMSFRRQGGGTGLWQSAVMADAGGLTG